MNRTLAWLILLTAPLAGSAIAANEIREIVFGSGGGSVVGAQHEIRATIGQTLAGTTTAPQHRIEAGFWSTRPRITSAPGEEVPVRPIADRLYQNAPNPFNPTTTIHYDIATQSAPVQLRIYDVAGHLVRTLVNEVQGPGRKNEVWRGRDERGSPVSSGVYFYVLQTPTLRATRKMTLVQ